MIQDFRLPDKVEVKKKTKKNKIKQEVKKCKESSGRDVNPNLV